MVKVHIDCLSASEQTHCHVEFHEQVIELGIGVKPEHVATPRLVFNVFTRKFLYGRPDGMTRRNTNFGRLTQVTLASVDILYAVSTTEINIKQCGYYLVPLVAIISLAARSKCLVDDFA